MKRKLRGTDELRIAFLYMDTIVYIEFALDPETKEIAHGRPFLVADLLWNRAYMYWKEPDLLAQMQRYERSAYFEARWEGNQLKFGKRISSMDALARTKTRMRAPIFG